MKAKIYQPSKSVTQSGSAKSSNWILEFSRSSKTSIDPVMKWTSSSDTQHQVKIKFASKELAIAFAEKNSIDYTIRDVKKRKIKPKSYSDNFSYDKKTPWTH
tara:strand:- start:403 stop:708 length:306 start_codon:yes stop_codon:yes gene_type:complete